MPTGRIKRFLEQSGNIVLLILVIPIPKRSNSKNKDWILLFTLQTFGWHVYRSITRLKDKITFRWRVS